MRNLFLFFFLFFAFSGASAQGVPAEYQKAKTALLAKDYWAAMNGFKPLTDSEKYGNLANYAAFHLAEAALGANQPASAITALQPIYGKNWNKSDEAMYLLAIAYFQNSQNLEALRVIQTIKKEEVVRLSTNATYEYLSKATASFLVAYLEEFKSNEGYTAALAAVLQKQTIMSSSEIAALKQVRASSPSVKTAKDETLDLVVILPFTGSGATSIFF